MTRNSSIDQYSGPMVALPAAWGLLRDDGVKDRVAHQLTCYLKRLQRIEVRNLQQRPDLFEAVMAALGGVNGDLTNPTSTCSASTPSSPTSCRR